MNNSEETQTTYSSQKSVGSLKVEIPSIGEKCLFKHTESFMVSREALIRDYLNADTPYDRYKVLMRAISWLEAKEELATYREQEITRLRSEIKGYNLEEYIDDAD